MEKKNSETRRKMGSSISSPHDCILRQVFPEGEWEESRREIKVVSPCSRGWAEVLR